MVVFFPFRMQDVGPFLVNSGEGKQSHKVLGRVLVQAATTHRGMANETLQKRKVKSPLFQS